LTSTSWTFFVYSRFSCICLITFFAQTNSQFRFVHS
jgi:hypothetical protein